jgi:poly(hydroxyalkanoate) depolymerase family esterase
MKNRLSLGMAKATDLTRSGKVQEATDLIRSLLDPSASKSARVATVPTAAGPDSCDVIDGEFTRLHADTASIKPERGRSFAFTRSTLSETLRKIGAGGMPARGPLAAEPLMPQGAQFLTLTHHTPQGSRDVRLYVPARRPDAPMPLIIMLHGCTQSAEDFATGTGMNALAEEFGCLVAYPAQPTGANLQKCWNWFRPEDQLRGQGEPALIAGLTREIQRDFPADPKRTYIAGLSAGAAAAVIAAAAYPDLFAAVGVHSGLPQGAARDVASAFAAMRSGTSGLPYKTALPTIVVHGLADTTVHPRNGEAVITQALQAMDGLKRTVQKDTSEGGQRYSVTAYSHEDGHTYAEHWQIDGAGHAWAGGNPNGSYTDPKGPDVSRQMLRFFLQHHRH